MKFVNCTSQEVILRGFSQKFLRLPASTCPAIVRKTKEKVQILTNGHGFSVYLKRTVLGEILNLPLEEEGVFLIVRKDVAEAAAEQFAEREDIVIFDNPSWNEAGKCEGGTGLRII